MGANPQDLTTDSLTDDIDNNARPTATLVSAGAHEVGSTAPPPGAPLALRIVRMAPVRASHTGNNGGGQGSGNNNGQSGQNGSTGGQQRGPRADATEHLRAELDAFTQRIANQRDMGVPGLIGLGLVLAAIQLGRVAMRRRYETEPVISDEQDIEGGEQQ